jgi:hypothetical protein
MIKRTLRRSAVVTIFVGLFVAAIAGDALARTGNGSVWVGNSYVNFNGSVYWWPNGSNHGGMEVYGNLNDTSCDSNSVRVYAKVSGYGYTMLWSNSNGCGSSVYGDKVVYDPQATQVDDGWIKVCRYNSWGTDKCTEEYQHR